MCNFSHLFLSLERSLILISFLGVQLLVQDNIQQQHHLHQMDDDTTDKSQHLFHSNQ